MAFITALLLATAVAASDTHGDTAGSDALRLVEIALNNISSQISVLKMREEQVPAYLGESLTSVTSLLQLSLLREMVIDKKESDECSSIGTATPDKVSSVVDSYQEYVANITDSIQQAIDERIANIENQQRSLQTQMSAISSQLTSMQNTISMQNTLIQLLSNPNTHQETFDDITDCIANNTGPLPHSCEDILASSPDSPSDYYTIADSNGHTRQVYCHMDKDICGSQGGWTRIAMINMTDTEQTCPYGLGLYNVSGVRACGRPSYVPWGCASTTFQSNQVVYSRVCGKVLGYQYGITYGGRDNRDINSAYIDGISLTHGYPRYHIWSYISGYKENYYSCCPCGSTGVRYAPSLLL